MIDLGAAPEIVWNTITRADELAAWFGADVVVDPRPGGAVRFRWRDGSERAGVVEVVDRPRRFAFRWRRILRSDEGIEVGETSRVEFLIEASDGRTRLIVTEHPGIVHAERGPADSLEALGNSRPRPTVRASA